jgi:hypothetical protein
MPHRWEKLGRRQKVYCFRKASESFAPSLFKMSAEVGQFDDAVEVDSRPGHAYIDQDSTPQFSYVSSDSSLSDDDFSEDLDEDFDDLRVEDEDWEISEKGMPFHIPSLF